jgi:hypothetical protein
MPELTPAATKLILDYEVGGGQKYYDKKLLHPTWPGGASGVTIGVGYDLGYNAASQFQADWGARLSAADFKRLSACLGAKAARAHGLVASVKDISVPWAAASAVFFAFTVPRFYREALGAFPGMDKLPGDAQGALVSLVFNRGTSMKGDSRAEMRSIRELVPKGDLKGIAAQLRAMERLWKGKHLDGLIARREAEAKLVENAKGDGAAAPAATPGAVTGASPGTWAGPDGTSGTFA